MRAGRIAAVLLLTSSLALHACGGDEQQHRGTGVANEASPEPPRPAPTSRDSADLLREDRAADSVIVMERLAWVARERLDTLDTGALVARIGRTFVGTPYVPQTLELAGEERLIINLRALDCVTFIENSLAIARAARRGGGFAEFLQELQRIRYRTGEIAGYPSRLHYFSEWIAANQEKGLVTEITREIGGVRDPEPLNFMSGNRSAYRQLGDQKAFEEIRALEQRLSNVPRYYIPEQAIGSVADRIRDGDIIAATSSVPGLDVAHTGIAVWEAGKLHLMHAPLVGDSVEISDQPLAVRIQRIEKQDGIMVARPR